MDEEDQLEDYPSPILIKKQGVKNPEQPLFLRPSLFDQMKDKISSFFTLTALDSTNETNNSNKGLSLASPKKLSTRNDFFAGEDKQPSTADPFLFSKSKTQLQHNFNFGGNKDKKDSEQQ